MSLRHSPPLRRISSEPLEPDPVYTGGGMEVCVTSEATVRLTVGNRQQHY